MFRSSFVLLALVAAVPAYATPTSSSAGYALPGLFSSAASGSDTLDINHDGIVDFTFTNVAGSPSGFDTANGLSIDGGSNAVKRATFSPGRYDSFAEAFSSTNFEADSYYTFNNYSFVAGTARIDAYGMGGYSHFHHLNGATGYLAVTFADASGAALNGYIAGVFSDGSDPITFQVTDYGYEAPAAVALPEPATVAVLGAAMLGLGALRRRG